MGHPWPLTSSHLNTASVYSLLDLSSFSLPSTLVIFFHVLVFSTYLFICISFLQFLRAQGCPAVLATPQPTAIQQQHHNNNSIRYMQLSTTSVSTRVRQRKQARMKEQVKCCRESAMYEYFYVSFFPHSLSFRLRLQFIIRNANRQQHLVWIFQARVTLSPVAGRRPNYTIFSVDIGVTGVTSQPSLCCHFNHMFKAFKANINNSSYCCAFSIHPASTSPAQPVSVHADSSS